MSNDIKPTISIERYLLKSSFVTYPYIASTVNRTTVPANAEIITYGSYRTPITERVIPVSTEYRMNIILNTLALTLYVRAVNAITATNSSTTATGITIMGIIPLANPIKVKSPVIPDIKSPKTIHNMLPLTLEAAIFSISS